MTPYLQDAYIMTCCVNTMLLSLGDDTTINFFWLCVTITPKVYPIRTVVLILLPWDQCILIGLILFSDIRDLANSRRENVCVVELWIVLLNMIVSKIDTIQDLINPRLVGAPQSHQAHSWIEEVFHHMLLVKEQGIIDEYLDPPTKIILQS